jgi:hypothetical protein
MAQIGTVTALAGAIRRDSIEEGSFGISLNRRSIPKPPESRT